MKTGFSGTTASCLAHLASSVPEGERRMLREKVATAVGVKSETVRRWFRGDMLPIGEALLRFRMYLLDNGYTVSELADVRPELLGLSRAIARRAIEFNEVVALLRYAYRDTLFDVLAGKKGISDARLLKVRALNQRLGSEWTGIAPVQTTVVATPITPQEQTVVDVVALHLKGVIPMLMDLLRREDNALRRALREQNHGLVFDASNLLVALCSETARERWVKEGQHGEVQS